MSQGGRVAGRGAWMPLAFHPEAAMNVSRSSSRPAWFRTIAFATLVAFSASCHSWSVVPLKEIEGGKVVEESTLIRVHPKDGGTPVTLDVKKVDLPQVTGLVVDDEGGEKRVATLDLREAGQVEVRSLDGWRTAGLVTGIVLGTLAIVALIVALTKTSCPFVYVDGGDGLHFVGEAYSGATSRATQRHDLLPLPRVGARTRIVLSNEARETQFTDLAEVVLVDRAPGVRTLSTPDARLVTLRESAPPLAATDLEGRDVLPLVRAADGRSWMTDLDEVSRRPSPPLREGLVLSFAAPPGGGPAALELDAGNTPWLDVVFGRFFALLGDRLEAYLDESDRPGSRDATLAWREREGVDLLVEVERAGAWRKVAVVPTVGPASLRRFAVPLPAADGATLRVRVSGGVGFLVADRVALAPIASDDPPTRRVAVARAVQPDGRDARAALAAADGDFQVLADRGDRVDLAFELPPPAAGQVRDAFLHTSGYYRVHRPPQAELSAGTLYTLRDEPGSLSRFSVDLYRRTREAMAGPVAVAP
jgi:hypothetical protein